ncbi:hypothetical protein ABD71_18445 [Brevibacillus laterosporus]|nr:hypothetical protein [Brevibacillus laterosporus]
MEDAANAVNKAMQYVTPDANAYGMVSSHNDLFKQKNRELDEEFVYEIKARPVGPLGACHQVKQGAREFEVGLHIIGDEDFCSVYSEQGVLS